MKFNSTHLLVIACFILIGVQIWSQQTFLTHMQKHSSFSSSSYVKPKIQLVQHARPIQNHVKDRKPKMGYDELKTYIQALPEDRDVDCPQEFIDRYPEHEIPKSLALRNFRGMKGEDKFMYKHFFHNYPRPGTFIELGAVDGVGLSNTIVFQKKMNWTGVLIEPQTTNYAKLEENRRGAGIETIHGAICTKPSLIRIVGEGGQAFSSAKGKSIAMCEPMKTLLSRTGLDHVDFYSIDVEGGELDVVITHDWEEVPVFTTIVEMRPRDESKNKVVRNALKHFGLCRFASEVGHHNEVWVNMEYPEAFE